jgi:hypothetical protein
VVLAVTAVIALALGSSASAQQGGASPPAISVAEATDIALDYVRDNAEELGLLPADVANLLVTDAYQDKHNGVTHVYLRQVLNGLPVNDANMTVNVSRKGDVISSPHHFIRNLGGSGGGTLQLGAAASAEAAADELGLETTEPIRVLSGAGPASSVVLSDGGVAEGPIPANLVYQALGNLQVRLAWLVEIEEDSGDHHWSTSVDAVTGELLVTEDFVIEESTESIGASFVRPGTGQSVTSSVPGVGPRKTVDDGSSYRVYAIPFESPNDGPRTLVRNPADFQASPFGWHDTDGVRGPEFTITRGNNAHAYTDRLPNDNIPDPGSDPDGGPGLDFDFPINFALDPVDYAPAAVTNLFYWCNIIHDVLWNYGFDEQAGNYQVNNYGRGGNGNDAVRCEAQDGNGTNNANFSSGGADGGMPRMQMFLWTYGRPNSVTIAPPSSAAGTYEASAATFGPPLTVGGTVYGGSVAIGNDGAGTSPTDGCEPLVGFPAGSIALLDDVATSVCEYTTRVKNAQNAGATAVIVIQDSTGNPSTMNGTDATITIPSVMIHLASGNAIKAGLPANASIYRDPVRGVRRDGDLDSGIVAHEYGHGVSNRLTGGPMTSGCLSGQEQMGEGWSDWQSLTLTALAADKSTDMRGLVPYALYQPNRYNPGLRPTAYSTDMSINPSTYDTVKTAAVPHGVGYTWNSMLWEVYWNIVHKYGFNPNIYDNWKSGGNNLAVQLIHDGMKYQVCDPGFVDGRDAILAADVGLTGGKNQCEIWRGFTKRGLGFGAIQGTSASRSDGTQSFDLPLSCFFTAGKFQQFVETDAIPKAFPGNTVPVTFSLVGDKGLSIFAAGSPTTQQVDCATRAPIGASSPAQADGSLTYNAATDSYTYPWQTQSAWAGTCRALTLTFTTGYSYTGYLRF